MKSKLLSINNFHYRRAGCDGVFLDHDRLFRDSGWDTAIFSMHHRDNLISPWQDFFVREIELAREYSWATKLRLAGKVLYSHEARSQIERLLRVFTPDIVHIHSIYHHISPAILPVLRQLKVPIVLTAHDYKLACPAYKMFDGKAVCEDCRGGSLIPLLRKRCLHGSIAISALVALEAAFHRWRGYYERYIDRIICPSRFHLEKLVEWGWPRERLTHIPNFFDPVLWQPRFEPGRYFLYCGRLAPEKGLGTLIRAAAMSSCPVKIVGWGDQWENLVKEARRNDAPVEFIDRLPAQELAGLVGNARAVVLPSENYENASLALVEGFACGKPAIATAIGGNLELVSAEQNGWLFEPGDAQALAGLLKRIWELPDAEVQAYGLRARAFVCRRHSSQAYYEAMTQLYRDLGAKAPRGSPQLQPC